MVWLPISSVYKTNQLLLFLGIEGLKQTVELLNKDQNLIVATFLRTDRNEDEIRKRIIDVQMKKNLKTRLKN